MQAHTEWSVTQPTPRDGPGRRRAPKLWVGAPAPQAGHSWPLLTNREELSFFTVLAFPKASRMGLACSSCRSNSP